MTTHDKDKIIAAAKEAGFPEWENTDDPEFLKVIEKLYVVAFQSGSASRDAEIQRLQFALADSEALELGTAERCYQLRAQINVLRDALAAMLERFEIHSDSCIKQAITAIASTPEQSLAKYRNKVIEAFVNEFSRHVGGDGEFWLHELQDFAMKEQP